MEEITPISDVWEMDVTQGMDIVRKLFPVLMALLASASPAFAQRGGPASVFVEPVVERDFSNRIEALGTLEANERVDLTVNVADRVTGVFFEDAERVEQGRTLLSLVQGEQAAQVEAAEATVAEARSVVERMRPLIEDGVVSRVQFDEAQRNLEVARANLTAVQIQQSERVLIAPFDGVLGFRRVSVGSYLRPGDLVTTLIDDSVMKLDFAIPSVAINDVHPGLRIEARTDDFPNRLFVGQVEFVDNAIDPITRSITVRALIPNDDRLLRAGTFMSVVLEADPARGLAIPEEAIQPVGPRSFVFTAEAQGDRFVARRQEVTLGRRQTGIVEVLTGLEPDEQVITEGVIRVREGAPIVIRDKSLLLPDAPAETPAAAAGPSSTAAPG